jgi:hypothetical protein
MFRFCGLGRADQAGMAESASPDTQLLLKHPRGMNARDSAITAANRVRKERKMSRRAIVGAAAGVVTLGLVAGWIRVQPEQPDTRPPPHPTWDAC